MKNLVQPRNAIVAVKNLLGRSVWRHGFLLMSLALSLGWLALAPAARATCLQGCNTSNGNTYLGNDALVNNTTGAANTAIGDAALFGNSTGSRNLAIGNDALPLNTTGNDNTAIGNLAFL